MCVIFVADDKKNFLELGQTRLNRAWQSNKDGAGVMYHDGKRIVMFKGIMSLKGVLWTVEKRVRKGCPIAVHFRLATHGAATKENTHPFQVDSSTAIMHNGILSNLGKSGKDGMSDSAHLAKILKYVPQRERASLLDNLDGKFCLANSRDGITTHGNFEKVGKCYLSNTNFDRWMHYNGSASHYKPASVAWWNNEEKRLEYKNEAELLERDVARLIEEYEERDAKKEEAPRKNGVIELFTPESGNID